MQEVKQKLFEEYEIEKGDLYLIIAFLAFSACQISDRNKIITV